MPRKILMHKYRGVGSPRVDSVLNGSLEKVANNIPASMESHDNDSSLTRNSVAEFEGDIYVVHGYNVYKSIKGTGNWTLDFDAAGLSNTVDGYDLGLYPAIFDTVPYLYHIWSSGATTWVHNRKSGRFAGSGSWEPIITHSTTNLIENVNSTPIQDTVMFNNVVYFQGLNRNGANNDAFLWNIGTFNLQSESFGSIAHIASEIGASAPNDGPFGGFCVFNNRLYFSLYYWIDAGTDEHARSFEIKRIDGSSISDGVLVDSVTDSETDRQIDYNVWKNGVSSHYDDSVEGRQCLFTDGDFMYSIHFYADGGGAPTNEGWKFVRISGAQDGSLTWAGDFTTVVLPQFAQTGVADISNRDGRWTSYTQVDSSGNQEIFLTFSSNGEEGTTISWYKFNGIGASLEFLGFGADTTYSVPNYRQGGGQYQWSVFKPLDIQIENLQPSTTSNGAIQISYRIINGSGQAVQTKFFFDLEGEATDTQCQLINPNQGSIVGGNVHSGITADSGNLYTVNWRAELQGVSIGNQYAMVPYVIIA